MRMVEVKIVDVREIPSGDPTRIGRLDVMVTYSIDAFRTYVTVIPKEEFNEETLKERIKKEQTERERWIGKTVKIE